MTIFVIAFEGQPLETDSIALELEERLVSDESSSLWVSSGRPEDVAPPLRRLLQTRRVRNAMLLSSIPSHERLELAFEWSGKLLVETRLVELLGEDLPHWSRFLTLAEQAMVVLQPSSDAEPSVQVVESPEEFRGALRSREPVVAWADAERIVAHPDTWFGELAEPATGGAIAILSLCGAAPRRNERILLRNPAALGLEFAEQEGTLAASLRSRTVRAVAIGMSRAALYEASFSSAENASWHETERSWSRERHTPSMHHLRASSDEWERELEALRSSPSPGSYLVMLELSAPVDPEIVIGEGIVIEQTSLNGVQTLANARPRSVRVDINQIIPVALPAHCLNRQLAPPAGEPVRPTALRFPVEASQDGVWRAVDDYIQRSHV
jgi:hypothetical protein